MQRYQGSGFAPTPAYYPDVPAINIDFNMSDPTIGNYSSGWNGIFFIDATGGTRTVIINDVFIDSRQGSSILMKVDSTPNIVQFMPTGPNQTLNGSTDPYQLTEQNEWVEITQYGTNGFIVTNSSRLLKQIEESQQLISPPVDGNLVRMDANGRLQDAGVSISTNPTSNTNNLVMTAQAVQSSIAAAQLEGIEYQGLYDASTNLFPTLDSYGGPIKKGDYWRVSVPGILGGQDVVAGDEFIAEVDTPGQTPANWTINFRGVVSFNDRAGIVVPQTGDYTVSQVTGAAPLDSPAFINNPTAPTQIQGDNSTKLATTAYADMGLANERSFVQNLNLNPIKVPAQLAYTTPLGTYAGLLTQGGYTLVPGDRVVLTAEIDTTKNVIWTVGDIGPTYNWSIATDNNSAIRLKNSFVYVEEGDNQGKYFAYVAPFGIGATLTPLTPATIPIGGQGREIIAHPNGQWVYCCASNSLIAMYNADATTGQLTAMTPATVATDGLTRGLKIHPTLSYAYSASQTTNNINMYSVGVGGVLAPLTPSTFGVGNTSSCVAIHPNGLFAYVSKIVAATNGISILSIDQLNGQLGNVSTSNIGFPAWIDISSDGLSFYTATNNQIIHRIIDPVTGLLSGGASYSAGSSGSSVVVHPNQKFVYGVSASATQTVVIYSRDITTGALTFVSQIDASGAIELKFNDDGSVAYLSSSNVPYITYYSVDLLTGLMTATGNTSANINSARGSAISPNQKFLYVSSLSTNVAQFTRLNTLFQWQNVDINTLESDVNTLTSQVLGQIQAVDIINSVEAVLDTDSKLSILVNGEESNQVQLPVAIAEQAIVISSSVSRVITATQDGFTGGVIDYQSGIAVSPFVANTFTVNLNQVGTYKVSFAMSVDSQSGTTICSANITNIVVPGGSIASIRTSSVKPLAMVQDTVFIEEIIQVTNVSGGSITISPTAGCTSGTVVGNFSSIIYEVVKLNGSALNPEITSNFLIKNSINKLLSRINGFDSNELDIVQSVIASTVGNSLSISVNGQNSNTVSTINTNSLVYNSGTNQLQSVINSVASNIVTLTGGGGGGVTSVATANGFAGSVAGSVLTLNATPTGMLKANGTALQAATIGTDYTRGTGTFQRPVVWTGSTGVLGSGIYATDYGTAYSNSVTLASVLGASQDVTGGIFVSSGVSVVPSGAGPTILQFDLNSVGVYEVTLTACYKQTVAGINGVGRSTCVSPAAGIPTIMPNTASEDCSSPANATTPAPVGVVSRRAYVQVASVPVSIKPQLGQVAAGSGTFTSITYSVKRLS